MKENVNISANSELFKIFNDKLIDVRKQQGSIICIDGESGYGKTHVLNQFGKECMKGDSGVDAVVVEAQAPIGKFQVGNLQPLLPFTRAMEKIISKDTLKKGSAMSNLIKNTGITLLASIPITDIVFYAVKEIGRDIKQYKEEKAKSNSGNISNVAMDFYSTLKKLGEKKPLILMFDDMHWADAQSIEVLNLFAETIQDLPILMLITYKKSIVLGKASPLLGFINQFAKSDNYDRVGYFELEDLDSVGVHNLINNYLKGYKRNDQFEKWIISKSYGVPGVIVEYLKYFNVNSPFEDDWKLKEDFESGEYVPTSVQAAFSQMLENLSEEDKNLMSLCSAEGRQFTAVIISELMNTDILTTIKRLRYVQNKTGIIYSMGAKNRYGMKTTVYEFSQAFYQSFFENQLEFEEHVALHGQIANLLKKRLEDSDSDAVKDAIAPYVAAHSVEAGDEETARTMLLASAQAASKTGSHEIIEEAYENFRTIYGESSESEFPSKEEFAFKEILRQEEPKQQTNGLDESQSDTNGMPFVYHGNINYDDFYEFRQSVVDDYHLGKYSDAAERSYTYYTTKLVDLRIHEKAQLLALAVKSYCEIEDLHNAQKINSEAMLILEETNDPIAECFIYNASALMENKFGSNEKALQYLQLAATRALELPSELKMLTLANIALILESTGSDKYRRYLKAAKQLTENLHFDEIAREIFN
jgi:AAA ATPase-like protein